MLAKNNLSKLYETILSIPGMNEQVNISLQVSRKNLLLLHKVIERGLLKKQDDEKNTQMFELLTENSLNDLHEIAGQLLHRAGLTEMNEKLNSFSL